MRSILVCASLILLSACSGHETGPTSILTPTSSAAVSTSSPAAEPVPSPVRLPGVTVSGPTGCQTVTGDMIWDVRINDAGIDGVRGFVVHANHSGKAGCEATGEDERAEYWLKHTAGPSSYRPHQSDTTRFAAQNRWSCGRDQFDIIIQGQGLIMALVNNHGVDCPPETPEPPVEPPVVPPVPPEPPIPPVVPPVPPIPPVEPPAPPVPMCYQTRDIFAGPIRVAYVSGEVFFDLVVRPEFPNAQVTVASYQKTGSEWLPQTLLSKLIFNANPVQTVYTKARKMSAVGSGQVRVTPASCGAQVDLFPCYYNPPDPLNESNIVEASAQVLSWWDDSPVCPGMRAPSRAHLWSR